MANSIHGVLQAMDNLANVPVLLTARLLQPAPPRQHTQSAADLTPPKVVKRKRRLTLPLDEVSPEVSGRTKWYGKRVVRQRTSEQLQSPLMRLPAELREQIWRYVILNSTGRYDSKTRLRFTGGVQDTAVDERGLRMRCRQSTGKTRPST
jgi:hypothetical protein